MQITIDLMQLLVGLLIVISIALVTLLFILLVRQIGTLRKISRFVDDVHGPLTESIRQFPDLIKRLGDVTGDAQAITGSVRSGVEAIGGAAADIGDGVSSFLHSSSEGRGGVLGDVVELVGQVLSIVDLFTGRNRNPPRRRHGHRHHRR
jgi:predicted PurR-regulated permease PerM